MTGEVVSWKDVASAIETSVEKSEKRILAAIDDLKEDKDEVHRDHEDRIRKVEDQTRSIRAIVFAAVTAVTLLAAILAIAKNAGII